MNLRSCLNFPAAAVLTFSLAACGGGGGGTTLIGPNASYQVTGTVAYGHPVTGQTIEAIDAQGNVCARATTATDGTYAMSTTSCAPGSAAITVPGYSTPSGAPLMALAVPPQGSPIINGVVNIDPLTTLLAYAAAGLVPSSVPPANSGQVLAVLSKVTSTQYLQAKANVLTAPLLQALGANGVNTTGFDPTTTPFVANGEGLDRFFDANPLSAPTSSSVQIAAPASAGPLVRVTLPTTTGSQSAVTSVSSYTLGGRVSGLSGGLLTLLLNGGGAFTINANGTFTFPTAISSTYAITVGTQPNGQTCTVSNGVGAGVTANVSNVSVTCSTNTYTISGTVSGLASGTQITLNNNAADPTIVTANGSFTFATPVAYNGSYAVTVGTQPTGQTCTVSNDTGAGVAANVTNVAVICVTTPTKISFIYIPDYGNNRILGYTYNHTTGAIGNVAGGPFTAGSYPRWVTTNPAGTFLYAANSSSNNISAYTVNATTGALTPVPGGPFASGTSPNGMVVNPAGTLLFVVNSNGASVSVYSINQTTGALTLVGSPYAVGAVPTRLAITPNGQFLYVLNQNSHDISCFAVDSTNGTLTPIGSPVSDTGAVSQGGYGITVNPAGTVLYVVNWEANITAFTINPTSGALTPVSGSPFTANYTGWGWQSASLSPDGKLLFASTGNGGKLLTYSVDATTGALTQLTADSYGAYGYAGTNYTVPDPTGKYLYVSNALAIYGSVVSIDSTTGALQELPGSPFSVGARPFDLAVVNP
ncbi:MAG: lactonase family protein [Rhodocyclales bacterium]|nr:lactonase family protein [Rhodocyclales bacterium]